MKHLFLGGAAALLLLGLAYLYRLAAGPSAFDRILGLSGFTSNITMVLVLTGVIFERLDMFVDIALGYALLSFVGVIAAARYFEQLPEK
ncbi:MAG: monovalent cation/H+ antiporter complex subunit F [Candidatus Rokuibacteriota bacterium]